MTQSTDTRGRRALQRWAAKNDAGPRALAMRLDADPGQLSRILAGLRKPGVDLACRIEDATGIPVREWTRAARGRA